MPMEGIKGEAVDPSPGSNRLIDCLPAKQRTAFLNQCERIELEGGTVLCEAGEPLEHAYFPIVGNISLVNAIAGHQAFDTGSIGNMGMLGVTLLLGVNRAPQRGVVQTSCLALRITASRLQAMLKWDPALFRILQQYLFVVLADLSQTTGCIRFHDAGKRLARTLLLSQDHTRTSHLNLTHQLLADMLGVQRGAVTIAASVLQQEGIIRYSRGKISILDREALEAKSCECYAASIKNHTSILP